MVRLDRTNSCRPNDDFEFVLADLTDFHAVDELLKKFFPEVIIHCAGIAHQKIGKVNLSTYLRVNSEATESFAKAAAKYCPDVVFIFLSSVSIYGEGGRETEVRRQEAGDGRQKRWRTGERATGVSPGVGCLTTLSVLVYEKTWRNVIWTKQKKEWFVNAVI